jgi:hypothetical protein
MKTKQRNSSLYFQVPARPSGANYSTGRYRLMGDHLSYELLDGVWTKSGCPVKEFKAAVAAGFAQPELPV